MFPLQAPPLNEKMAPDPHARVDIQGHCSEQRFLLGTGKEASKLAGGTKATGERKASPGTANKGQRPGPTRGGPSQDPAACWTEEYKGFTAANPQSRATYRATTAPDGT